jgi:DNA-binding LacI/PurR family transcriptional regulator
MATYGFDIDGTLTIPAIRNLASHLFASGHKIHIITGGLRKPNEEHKIGTRMAHRQKQLEKLGVSLYHSLHVCVGVTTEEVANEKAKVCREQGIDVMFEDSRIYIDIIRNYSKTVVVDVKN